MNFIGNEKLIPRKFRKNMCDLRSFCNLCKLRPRCVVKNRHYNLQPSRNFLRIVRMHENPISEMA